MKQYAEFLHESNISLDHGPFKSMRKYKLKKTAKVLIVVLVLVVLFTF